MLIHERHQINTFEQIENLIKQGLFFEVSRLPDTPIGKGDRLMGTDAFGHVLIARAPIQQ